MSLSNVVAEPDHGTYIWITQVQGDDYIEIAKLTLATPKQVIYLFSKIEEMYTPLPETAELCDEDVLVELVENGDLGNRQRVLNPRQARWLLCEYLKQPESVLENLKDSGVPASD